MSGIKERLIQFVLRGKDELSPSAKKSAEALAAVGAEAEALGKALDSAKDARGLAAGLKTTQRQAELAERSLVQADLQIKDLRDSLSKSPGAAGLEQSLKDAEREARRAQKALDGLRVEMVEQEAAAKAAGIDTDKLADEEKRLAAEVDKAKAALADNSKQLKALQREQAAASRSAAEHNTRIAAGREVMSRGAKQVLAFAAAYISLNAAFGLVQKGLNIVRDGIYSMLETGDQFELLDKRMASLMGSVAEGEQATAWIKQFAKETPLAVQDVTQAFALLKTYGLDPMDGTLQSVVDRNEQLGGGMERLTGIASALGQAYGKQKLQTEEILQLVERGVPVWDLLEKVTGKNTVQLQKLASEGRLGRDVIKGLIDEIGKGSQGAAADAMGTLTGRVSNLKDAWADFQDRISKSGAMDYVKKKLGEVAEKIDQMDKDGRLDKLAKALSDTFVNGAESVEKYIKKLGEVDFNSLADKASEMAKKIGPAIDQALTAGQYTTATLTTVWNAFSALATGTTSALSKVVQLTLGNVVRAGGQVAGFFGGSGIKAKAEGFYNFLGDLSAGFAGQAKTDLGQIGSAWDFLDGKQGDSNKKHAAGEAEKTATVKAATAERMAAGQAAADQEVANQQKVKQAVVDAAASGKVAITDMANAVNLIGDSKSLQQIDGLRAALLKAYQDGRLSLEQYQQATGLLGDKLGELGKVAKGTAGDVSNLDDKLADLAQVQAAISAAKTDVDINDIRTALRKLYSDGEITAKQYNDELKKTSDRHKELKAAIEGSKKAQVEKNDADKEAIKTSADLRRESGKRMEQERRAGDQAMQDRRRGSEETERDITAFEDFFGGVLTRAREPLAALSQAVLAVYDKLIGITTVDMSIDTSNLEATTKTLDRVNQSLAKLRSASALASSGLVSWALKSELQSQRLQVQYLEQKAALQELTEGYEDGSISLSNFVSRSKAARSSMNLLDAADLSNLDGAIDSARQKMQQLEQSSKSTLDGLRDELSQLRGDQEDVDRRRFASRKADLQAQASQAQASGDAVAAGNLMQALDTLRQLEIETDVRRVQAEQKKRADEVAKAATEPAQQPAKIIRLETAKGQAVDVAVQNDRDETNLLSILQDAGLRSL